MSAIVRWFPERLTARIVASARPAASDYANLARMRSPSKRVAASMRVSGGPTTFRVNANPLARIIEKGSRPHTIEPKRRVLRLADGRFVTGPVRHPGTKANPFLRPLLALWPSLFRRRAAGAFRGF